VPPDAARARPWACRRDGVVGDRPQRCGRVADDVAGRRVEEHGDRGAASVALAHRDRRSTKVRPVVTSRRTEAPTVVDGPGEDGVGRADPVVREFLRGGHTAWAPAGCRRPHTGTPSLVRHTVVRAGPDVEHLDHAVDARTRPRRPRAVTGRTPRVGTPTAVDHVLVEGEMAGQTGDLGKGPRSSTPARRPRRIELRYVPSLEGQRLIRSSPRSGRGGRRRWEVEDQAVSCSSTRRCVRCRPAPRPHRHVTRLRRPGRPPVVGHAANPSAPRPLSRPRVRHGSVGTIIVVFGPETPDPPGRRPREGANVIIVLESSRSTPATAPVPGGEGRQWPPPGRGRVHRLRLFGRRRRSGRCGSSSGGRPWRLEATCRAACGLHRNDRPCRRGRCPSTSSTPRRSTAVA